MILEIVILLTLVAVLYNLFFYIKHVLKLQHFPPGPFPLPIIGNLHVMGEKPYEIFRDLAKQYGDVFSVSLGMQRVVIINTVEPAREALITKGTQFAGRPSNHYTSRLISRGYKDIAFADYGPMWIFMRKLGHAALKMYGDGVGNLETLVVKESKEMHVRLKEKEGQPVDVFSEFGLSVLNIICTMVFGTRYDIDDAEFLEVIKMSDLLTSGFSNGDPVAFLPWLRVFPMSGLKKVRESLGIRDPLFRKKLRQHKDTFNSENIRDFTDSLIKSIQEEKGWENAGVKEVTDDHLEMIINDIFLAGSETTSTTLRWMVTYLLHWPQYQDKVFKEIAQVIGLERYPELKDRPNLPLTQAVIQETLRLSSLVPLGVMHKAMERSTIGGINIPKGALVIFNLWNIHHDPKEWEHPNEFNPHRWLNEEGRYVPGRHKSYLPFSAGRRSCLGESMAKTELFLFLSRLIRDFKIETYSEEPFPSLQGRIGVTLSPNPFKVIFTSRDTV